MSPFEIASTWTIDELENAAVLGELEGWGQQKRLVARLCAEIHNAITNAVYATSGGKDTKPPPSLSESLFLPKRVKRRLKVAKSEVTKEQAIKKQMQRTSEILNSLAGF